MTAKVLADKMDEAIRLRNHQERFIDMISHEIRNPLSAVLHCSEEILEALKTCLDEIGALSSVLPPETVYFETTSNLNVRVKNALEASNTIMYCVQHQKQIVDDVLTLSKLDADLLVVSPVPVEPMVLQSRPITSHSPAADI
jgi:signal transduction histidine kinase